MRVVCILLLCWAGRVSAQTLADVLIEHKVPLREVSKRDAVQRITSLAVSETESPFLIAFYEKDGSGTLPTDLHVLRYNRRTGKLRHTTVHGDQTPSTGTQSVMRSPSSECMCATLSISEENGVVAIETHINPSAGCLLILDSQLKFTAGLWGWLLARVDGGLLFGENRIHFQPVEDAGLSIFDLARQQVSVIYPTNDDPSRRSFSEQLSRHLPPATWCAEHNNPCDPDYFNTSIDHVRTSNQATRFSFEVLMEPQGFGEAAVAAIKPRSVRYEYSEVADKWVLSSTSSASGAERVREDICR